MYATLQTFVLTKYILSKDLFWMLKLTTTCTYIYLLKSIPWLSKLVSVLLCFSFRINLFLVLWICIREWIILLKSNSHILSKYWCKKLTICANCITLTFIYFYMQKNPQKTPKNKTKKRTCTFFINKDYMYTDNACCLI